MQMYKTSIQTVALVIGFILAITVSRAAFAGDKGIIVGSLESGSVVGQSFKSLVIDAELVVVDFEGGKAWFPNAIFLSPKRGQRPVLLKVSNQTRSLYKFTLSEDPTFSSAVAIRADVELDPGESKYIGIPASDLSYVSQGSTLTIKSNDGIDGQVKFVFVSFLSR